MKREIQIIFGKLFVTMINFIIKSAFVTGALTAGAFLSGVAIGTLINKDKVINKVKKMQIKKNDAASTK